ncbi:hypothetical protein vBPpSSYP_133 [Pseudomonas phage vB_PpS_SYP]|nr:hypothetical protein vBPpSSYP_133 [Pseudomonas phage vB_PpS_SYP]
MIINLSPVRMDTDLTLVKEGNKLYVNDEVADFTQLLEGATLPREAIHSEWFVGDVSRVDGELVLTIRLPHGPNAPVETRFPSPITVASDGQINLPIYDIPVETDDGQEFTTLEVINE